MVPINASNGNLFHGFWLISVNFWEQNLEAGNEIITKTLKIPLDTISLDGVNLTNLQENQEFFRANSTNSIYDIAKIYADFFIRSGNVTRLPDLKSLFNSSFLRNLCVYFYF